MEKRVTLSLAESERLVEVGNEIERLNRLANEYVESILTSRGIEVSAVKSVGFDDDVKSLILLLDDAGSNESNDG